MQKNYQKREAPQRVPKPAFLRGLDTFVRFVSNTLLYFVIGAFVTAAASHYLGFDGFTQKVYTVAAIPFLAVVVLYSLTALMMTSKYLNSLFLSDSPVAMGTRKDYARENRSRQPRRETRQDIRPEPVEDGPDPEDIMHQ